ncbi:hypothetical protein APUTEX25_000525 [Auxenochlorella protothecoides]|uniref:Uncharacterized protein n=1 Tax=Auxenochlorella protothecoides TaxID=3075 RepID=A0A3M7KWV6_AUXPR|nr:hypothetical protein APUTEX25_000525 [Auxenochlorella protothecoides]|eukprot:RMZ55008.1 hypothetical protein APUTEX25_000525 [Auxenochlorella protothecoides]
MAQPAMAMQCDTPDPPYPSTDLKPLPVEAILCHDAGALGALGAALEAQRARKPEEPGLASGLESGEDGDATDLDPCFD